MGGVPMTILLTDRLALRIPTEADLEPSARFWASDRSHMMGGPWTLEKTREGLADLGQCRFKVLQ